MLCYDFPTEQWCGLGCDKDYDLLGVIARVTNDILQFASELRAHRYQTSSTFDSPEWNRLQEDEAKAFQLGGNAPLLTIEANARGVTVGDLVTKITDRTATLNQWEALVAGVSGKHRDAVARLLTVDDVCCYDWSTDWPL